MRAVVGQTVRVSKESESLSRLCRKVVPPVSGPQPVRRIRSPAIALGFVFGALLYFCFQRAQAAPIGYSGNTCWGWQVFEVAFFCAALGLAGFFPSEWRWSALSMSLGAVLTEFLPGLFRELDAPFRHMVPLPILLPFFVIPIVAFMSVPAAFIGSLAGRRLSGIGTPRFFFAVLPLVALAGTGALPLVDRSERTRIESDELPQLLQTIHSAEMAFNATAPDHGFSCDPSQMPSIRNLPWQVQRQAENEPILQRRSAIVRIAHGYLLMLECGEIGLRFEATVTRPGKGPFMTIDQTGELKIDTDVQALDRKRIETQELPALLRRIHQAEMRYRDTQADKTFTCDGAQLPGLERLRWDHNVLRVDSSKAELACGGASRPLEFQISVEYGMPPLFEMSMDETGSVTESR